MMTVTSLADIRARMHQPVHPLDGLEPQQIAGKLIDCGYSPRTAADAAEVAYSVVATLRTGIPVPPRWGWGD